MKQKTLATIVALTAFNMALGQWLKPHTVPQMILWAAWCLGSGFVLGRYFSKWWRNT